MPEQINPRTWDEPDMHRALAGRDVATVYKLLKAAGLSQRLIGALTGQSQSEVSEIINGRQVMAYDVLERIADGLGIPRGHMGLAYDEGTSALPKEGWASGDVGLIDQCRWHMHRAMDHARGQQERLAGVLASAGDMEKHYNAPNDALKLFQIATAGLPVNADPQSGAVLHGLAASVYLTLGHAEHTRAALKQSRKLFAEVAEPEAALPFFAFYGPGHGLLAATEAKLADYELARADVRRALDTRPDYDVRCCALDTIVLATILINSGELRDGISETRRALDLVTAVGSQRVRDRLEPLERALAGRRDSTCQDLARRVRTLRVPTASATT